MSPKTEGSGGKLLPRNVAAMRRGQSSRDATALQAGNAVSTRLEAGVGNCFPGLECDLRNLERRFFPYLEVNIADQQLSVVGLDLRAARSDTTLTSGQLLTYEEIERTLVVTADGVSNWTVKSMTGVFGPLGTLENLDIESLQPPSAGMGRRPPDCWTAIRLLTEGTRVVLSLAGPQGPAQLAGLRARYLGDDGALAAMFLPGELTQSLCSPWTHDFRDCACYYWASNHPDIVQPAKPEGASDPGWNNRVDWERSDRGQASPPPSEEQTGPVGAEMAHYDINNRWQQLHVVLRGREQIGPFTADLQTGTAYASDAELMESLRFAAGVELAVMQEYLCAAFSLAQHAADGSPLANALKASQAEIMRIAIGEMRHLRVVNEVISLVPGAPLPYVPALRVSSRIPTVNFGKAGFRPRIRQPLTPEALAEFIDVESAAHAVDQLYANIMTTFRQRGHEHLAQVIGSIIADGQDHLETFEFIQEWLAPFAPPTWLRPGLAAPPQGNNLHDALQRAYAAVLQELFEGYAAGLPLGAPAVNTARQTMVASDGLIGLAASAAAAGFLVVFEDLADPRFAPLP